VEKEEMSGGSGAEGPVICFEDVTKIYPLPAGDVVALDHISLSIDPGEFIAVMGPSGSGKTTLMNLMGCLDVPTSGNLYIGGRNVRDMDDVALTLLRRDTIGFVFQQFNLIPLLNVLENVEYPRVLRTGRFDRGDGHAEARLRAVGLDQDLFTHRPSELSGGQQQRVAIARALVNDPEIILCDEPTGNLDTKTGTGIMELLSQMNSEGKTVIVVTHDPLIGAHAQRIVRIVDGMIEA
jgi:putative ABC transport system ATP-binding protein